MNRGILLYANNNAKCDYIKQAYALALSIKIKNAKEKVALVTSEDVQYTIFDEIIKIPANTSLTHLHSENRVGFYDITPFDETIVMDVDMLVTQDMTQYWNYLSNFNLYFTTNTFTYRNKSIQSNYYRKMFTENNLPNVYCAFYYFKKNKEKSTYHFFNLQNEINSKWEIFYKRYAPKRTQKWPSMDVSSSIAMKILGLEDVSTDRHSIIEVTHLKPMLQEFVKTPDRCSQYFNTYVDTKGDVYVGNFKQKGILHYVEQEMMTDKNIQCMEEIYGSI